MLFNSLDFLFLFLPITYVVFWALKTKQQRYVVMTVAGYVFYGAWNYKFCALMAFSTTVSYLAGRGLLRWDAPRIRRAILIAAVSADLMVLAFFKYAGFFLSSVNALSDAFGQWGHVPVISVILPVGISFYTFHTITYVIDSYRRVITPTRNLFEFSCYVSLFSQLVAGPIVRFREVERDLENLDKADRTRRIDLGWSYFCLGLAKKVLIADTLASFVDPAFRQYHQLGTVEAWLCMLGYSYQLYYDFSGYSDMAVGLGHLFGIRLPQNFNSPYKATDPADFWKRWHISLSSCLKDYLYIPLGGNRDGEWRTRRNLMVTMLLGGLWHGANWTFVVWGAYHGLLLILHRAVRGPWDTLPLVVRRTLTFLLVVVGWVFFRSENFETALFMLSRMFSWSSGHVITPLPTFVAALALAGGIAHLGSNTWEVPHRWRTRTTLALGLVYLLCLAQIYGGQPSPFLYFQF